jgi:hypothetical protein
MNEERHAFLLAMAEGMARAALDIAAPWQPDLLSLSIGATGARRSVRGLGSTSSPFRQKLSAICGRLGCKPSDLAQVISFETVGSFSPIKENPVSGAIGLIQFMPSTLDKLGTNKERAAQMTAVEQLDLVEKYLAPWKGKLGRLSSLYMAVLWPRLVAANENAVVFEQGSIQYAQNAGLDVNKDGRVVVSEAVARVKATRNASPRVLLFGDSIAEGLEPGLRRAATADGAEVMIGVHERGTVVKQWAHRAKETATIAAPSVVVVALGSNDTHQPHAEDVAAIISAADEWGADSVWLGPFKQGAASEALSGLVWQAGGVLMDGPATLKEAGAKLSADGVHLDPTNYARVADAIWTNLGGSPTSTKADKPPTPQPTPKTRKSHAPLLVGLAITAAPFFTRRK